MVSTPWCLVWLAASWHYIILTEIIIELLDLLEILIEFFLEKKSVNINLVKVFESKNLFQIKFRMLFTWSWPDHRLGLCFWQSKTNLSRYILSQTWSIHQVIPINCQLWHSHPHPHLHTSISMSIFTSTSTSTSLYIYFPIHPYPHTSTPPYMSPYMSHTCPIHVPIHVPYMSPYIHIPM